MIIWILFGVAALIVLATSLIKDIDWSPKAKNLIAVVLSVVAAVATALATHNFDLSGGDILALSTSLYGSSQIIYHFILKDTTDGTLAKVNLIRKKKTRKRKTTQRAVY